MSEWRRFFLFRLPFAAVIVLAAAEIPAHFLQRVALHRHGIDDVASASMHDPTPYKVVLVGDSITHLVTGRFRIGDKDEVADLTTHMQGGLPSYLFLTRRYLASGHRPHHVVLASSRYILLYPLQKTSFPEFVQSVFTHPDEREYLQKNYPMYVDYRWKPALFSLRTRIVEPLYSLARAREDRIPVAPWSASPNAPLEQLEPGDPSSIDFQARLNTPDALQPEAIAALTDFCQLSRRYGFQLHIIWAPVEAQIWKTLQAKGTLRRIDEQILQLAAANSATISLTDTSASRDYLYFDAHYNHINGLGWEQQYANQLTATIHDLEAGRSQPVTAR